MQVCNLHVTCFEIRHGMSMPKSYRKFEICCLFTLASQTELLSYGHIVLSRTTTRRNFEARIFKLCRTITVVQCTGVQWVQKTYKVIQNRKGRQVCRISCLWHKYQVDTSTLYGIKNLYSILGLIIEGIDTNI